MAPQIFYISTWQWLSILRVFCTAKWSTTVLCFYASNLRLCKNFLFVFAQTCEFHYAACSVLWVANLPLSSHVFTLNFVFVSSVIPNCSVTSRNAEHTFPFLCFLSHVRIPSLFHPIFPPGCSHPASAVKGLPLNPAAVFLTAVLNWTNSSMSFQCSFYNPLSGVLFVTSDQMCL